MTDQCVLLTADEKFSVVTRVNLIRRKHLLMTATKPPESTPEIPPGSVRGPLFWGSVITALWLAFTLWAAGTLMFAQTDALALGGQVFLFDFLVTLLVFQALKLLPMLKGQPPAGKLRRAVELLISIVVGYVVALLTVNAMYARHDSLIMERIAPVVRALEAGQDDVQVSDKRLAKTLSILRGDNGFILSMPGASLDIDGSSVFYDSETQRLARFHNDLGQHPNRLHFERRTKDMQIIYPHRE